MLLGIGHLAPGQVLRSRTVAPAAAAAEHMELTRAIEAE
jgi:hypothetical protein